VWRGTDVLEQPAIPKGDRLCPGLTDYRQEREKKTGGKGMKTETELFFELLHKGRELKHRNIEPVISKAILLGMKWAMDEHIEDIKTGRNIQMGWNCQQSGAE